MKLTALFKEFFNSEKAGGLVLLGCTIASLVLANSGLGENYTGFWHTDIAGHSIADWINDGLMAIFFLLIGLELEREIYQGELSNLKDAMLPIFAALGGVLIPAAIYTALNYNTPEQSGAGIPMATDIAFALGILSLLGKRVPASLKVFLAAVAVIDDLCAILVIAIFYTQDMNITSLFIALGIFGVLLLLGRLKFYNLVPYIFGGIVMWYFMLQSGVHATITGVLLAFAIPFGGKGNKSVSYVLQHFLHKPVAFIILPVFALANTAILIRGDIRETLAQPYALGILIGLILGKPAGILLFSFVATRLKLASLPSELSWKTLIGVGFLAGIGFTMSIFITLLAFTDTRLIDNAKLVIMIASLIAGLTGFFFLKSILKKECSDS